jgi:hypothetical protein
VRIAHAAIRLNHMNIEHDSHASCMSGFRTTGAAAGNAA